MVITAAVAGACIGFLPYNMNPAKMFVGDTGATFLGFILATLSVQGMFKTYAILSLAIPFLILGLPIFDTAFAIGRRLAKGKNPMSPDRGHVHHRLIDMGFSQKQTVLILYLVSAILGAAAILLASSGAPRAILFVVIAVVAVVVAINVYRIISAYKKKKNDKK